MNIFKKAVINSTINIFFKDALLRVSFSKKKLFFSLFKNHEIVVKLKFDMINAMRCMNEKKFVKQFNDETIRNEMKNIHIRIINKFSNEDFAIQIKNAKKIKRLKKNKT